MEIKQHALLLSSKNGWVLGKNSLTLFENPTFSLSLQGGAVTLESSTRRLKVNDDPLAILENFLAQGYFGVGYLSYEFFRFIERDFVPDQHKDGVGLPDACFLFFDADDAQSKDVNDWLGELEFVPNSKSPDPRPNMSKTSFMGMVEKAREHIKNGDIYQVNLSQRFEAPFKIPSSLFLAKLYKTQPVPFACCLDFGEFQLVSGSMELFLRKTGRKLATRPIKGTRGRGMTQKDDDALRDELLRSEKERAENMMIVDLMRNDLGRVCEPGSVRVNKLFDIETYATLHQMVSEVEGRLSDEATVGDIIRSTFPPGSVTGAPKRRAMEIIDELEPHLRGPYCGAIGVFLPNGDFTLSVAIRILTASRGRCTFWVGGGIMWDSRPENEYEETLIKAKAIMQALA